MAALSQLAETRLTLDHWKIADGQRAGLILAGAAVIPSAYLLYRDRNVALAAGAGHGEYQGLRAGGYPGDLHVHLHYAVHQSGCGAGILDRGRHTADSGSGNYRLVL